MGNLDYYNRDLLAEIEKMKAIYGPKPQCYLLCLHLRSLFDGRIWYNMDHCVFMYRGGIYDHTGEITLTAEEMRRYAPLNHYGIEQIKPLQDAMFKTNGRLEI